jgi:hypothetical protein
VADIEVELIYSNFSALGDQMVRDADHQCNLTAHQVLARARILIQSGPKTGRVYKRGSRVHQASAPGESPATDTGALANASNAEQEHSALWNVTFTSEYAKGLEFGTPRVAARPFLRPAVEAERRRFVAAMRKIVGDV